MKYHYREHAEDDINCSGRSCWSLSNKQRAKLRRCIELRPKRGAAGDFPTLDS